MIRVAILLAVLQLTSTLNLPDDWTKCHRNDPNLNNCIKGAVKIAVGKLENGLPSLGLKSIDPLEINKMDVQQSGKSSAVSLKITLRNIKLHGISKSKVTKFDAHLENYRLEGEALTPVIELESDYVMDGQILVLPVTGKGRCNITFVEMKTFHNIQGKRAERGGEVYMDLEKYSIQLAPKRMHGYFDNLFNGDKLLGESVNQVINENSDLIFNELKPSLERELSGFFLDYTNGIFKNVPFDNLILP